MSRPLKLLPFSLVLLSCTTVTPSVAPPEAPEPPETRPNIVLIIGDDQNYRDFGFMGSSVAKTPNLDRLARGGTVFPNGYSTASMCRPALASLLTGLYPHQWQVRVDRLMKREEISDDRFAVVDFATLPRILSNAGYATFQAGKIWEGNFEMSGFTEGMADKLGGDEIFERSGGESLRLVRKTNEPVYDFIRSHRDDPFFVWFGPSLPHRPHNAPEKYRQLYRDDNLDPSEIGYYANIAWLDEGVGSLIDFIDSQGLRSRTLIVFVVDNGWTTGNTPYGGVKGKGSLSEGGFRTPIFFNWPGRVPEGAVHNSLASIVDLFPTLLAYAGAPDPLARPGFNMVPAIEGSATAVRNLIVGKLGIISMTPRGMGVIKGWFLRNDRFHFINRGAGRFPELYDISVDPDEKKNLASSEPTKVRRYERVVKKQLALDLEMLKNGGVPVTQPELESSEEAR